MTMKIQQGGNSDWDSEDELEVGNFRPPSSQAMPKVTEASSSASGSGSKVMDYFIGMGFTGKMVAKAIQANGEEDTDSILETLLTYSAIKESPEEQPDVESGGCSASSEILDDFFDTDSPENEVIVQLEKMGYSKEESSLAVERCGAQASIVVLTDFICAAQMAKTFDAPEEKPRINHLDDHYDSNEKKKLKLVHGDDEMVGLQNPMMGFGLPTNSAIVPRRTLPEAAKGPPYFYYENVALAPKGVWETISSFLYKVEPEFVDSKHICAAERKRGYVHNLPIHNRLPLFPMPPLTIHEALPMTKKWWPSWDTRTKLNCLKTVAGSAKLTEKIRQAVGTYEGEPPLSVKKFVLEQCMKYNLVWVGMNKVAPLEPDEIEKILGFPKDHTRGGGMNQTDRYKLLGNSFQIDTVAYHLSVLKDLFSEGINLLSLFSGIGGAEIALDRLGIRLNNVVSVEKSKVNRDIVRCWWEQTNQTGNLIDFEDILDLKENKLEQLIKSLGGFDLIVGGSPGLEGEDSSRFFYYWRILDSVKRIMKRNNANY
ncbi:DNA (cytosine-5)-methyltransferase DRM2-like [Euphorbia lathyris]|uniref:DNA (cytosine-5)-methyltransferase DRM2-like n=1 Tax=Euphorbia lathyris TaxID=212925 RepID=UPI00331379C4